MWVRLPYLPFEYYQSNLFFRIGNLIGKTLNMDRTIEMTQRRKFARLCIELDVSKPLVPKVLIGSKVHKVKYERMSVICFSCKCIGHRDFVCLSSSSTLTQQDISKDGGSVNATEFEKETKQKVASKEFGPWMIV